MLGLIDLVNSHLGGLAGSPDTAWVSLGLFAFVGILYTVYNRKQENELFKDSAPAVVRETTTIPGPKPSHPQLGNIMDIGVAGGYYHYLEKIHRQYGPLVSFWFADKLMVSLSSPQLYKETAKAHDRPPEMFEIFAPLMAKESLAFVNGKEAIKRRRHYDRVYTHAYMDNYYKGITQTMKEFVQTWESLEDKTQVEINQFTYKTAMQSVLRESFGDYFQDEQEIIRMKDNFDFCWHDLEERAGGKYPEPGSDRDLEFTSRRDEIYDVMRCMIAYRRKFPPDADHVLLIDLLLDYSEDLDDVTLEAEAVNFVIGGYMSTGDLMTWCLWLLAKHPEIQEKLYEEITSVLEGGEEISPQAINNMGYMKQVLDEALRVSQLGTFVIRRMDKDLTLNGHHIPAMTTLVQSIGVTHMDEELWPEPEKFDPDRFSPENSKSRPRYAFVPFGFGGGRQCPGFRFTYVELSILLSLLLRRFRLSLAPGQGTPGKYHGLLTFLTGDIFLTLEERK